MVAGFFKGTVYRSSLGLGEANRAIRREIIPVEYARPPKTLFCLRSYTGNMKEAILYHALMFHPTNELLAGRWVIGATTLQSVLSGKPLAASISNAANFIVNSHVSLSSVWVHPYNIRQWLCNGSVLSVVLHPVCNNLISLTNILIAVNNDTLFIPFQQQEDIAVTLQKAQIVDSVSKRAPMSRTRAMDTVVSRIYSSYL